MARAVKTDVKRHHFFLTEEEDSELNSINARSIDAPAWDFWQRVCRRRELDASTLIVYPFVRRCTALPIGHGKHWCFPFTLVSPPPPPMLTLVKDDVGETPRAQNVDRRPALSAVRELEPA